MELNKVITKLEKSKIKAGDGKKNGNYPLFTCSPTVNKYYDDFLYDTEAIILSTGGNPVINYYNGKFSYSTDCLAIKTNNEIKEKYLYYYLISRINKIEKMFRGVGIKHLNKNEFFKLEIEFPQIEVQEIVVEELDNLQSIINIRKKQIQQFEELIKSQFVEMFGHLSENTNIWNELSISEIVNGDLNNGYFAKRDEYVDNGNAEIIGVASVVNRMYSNIDNLPKTNASEKDIEKYRVKYGDLLFCRSSLVAEGIGKASIVPKNVKHNQLFECHVIRMHLNLKKCIPEYIQKLTEDDYFRNQLMKGAKTATMTTIGQGDILKCKVLLPPLELQNKFASFVEQINKKKFEIEKSLKEMQELYESLMDKYFG